MRIRLKDYGDERIVKRFTLFPLHSPIGFGDPPDEVLIWLETVYILQVVTCGGFSKMWENRRFATREEYLEYKKKKKEGYSK